MFYFLRVIIEWPASSHISHVYGLHVCASFTVYCVGATDVTDYAEGIRYFTYCMAAQYTEMLRQSQVLFVV